MFVTNLQGAGEEHFVIFDELLSDVSSPSLEGVRGANLSKSHVTDLSGTNYCLHCHFLIIIAIKIVNYPIENFSRPVFHYHGHVFFIISGVRKSNDIKTFL